MPLRKAHEPGRMLPERLKLEACFRAEREFTNVGNCRPRIYAHRELDYDPPMLVVTVWNRITTEFYGRSLYGSYVIENETITVKTARGQKTALLGNSKPHQLAERLLRELAAERKA